MEEVNTNKDLKIQTMAEKLSGLLFDSIQLHTQYMRQARGLFTTPEERDAPYNYQISLRAEAIPQIISLQMEMISLSKPTIEQKAESKPHLEELAGKLEEILGWLRKFEYSINKAVLNTGLKDSLVKHYMGESGDKSILTPKFYDLLRRLESTFNHIYRIMLKAGLLIDEVKQNQVRSKTNEL